MPNARFLRTILSRLVNAASHEWLLTSLRYANGGDIILLRSVLITIEVYAFVTAVKHVLGPARMFEWSWAMLVSELLASGAWYGPILAGVYASLYGRYASQWTYLANVYNRIKETEARGLPATVNQDAMAQWKAGFIEDADELHLATKPMFAGVIRAWNEPAIERAFKLYTEGGAKRWTALMERIGAPQSRPEAGCGERTDDIGRNDPPSSAGPLA